MMLCQCEDLQRVPVQAADKPDPFAELATKVIISLLS